VSVRTRRLAVLGAAVAVTIGTLFFAWRWPRALDTQTRAGPPTAASDGAAPQLNDIDSLRRAYGAAANDVARDQLLQRAGQLGTAEAAEWLAEVAEQNPGLASHASASLGAIDNPSAAAELLRLATNADSVLVRANAVRALGASGNATDTPPLAGLLSDEAQTLRIRQEAALALGRIGGPDAVNALATSLTKLEEGAGADVEQLRISIVQALGNNPTPAARTALTRHAARKLSETERAFTTRALAVGQSTTQGATGGH
jgi:HEAT repeat protein